MGLGLLLASTPAAADQVVIAGGEMEPVPFPGERAERRLDLRLGMLLGGADIGEVDGLSYGLHSQLGYRIGDVTVFGEYDYYRVGDSPGEDEMRRGRASRFGLTGRYSLLNGSGGSLGGDLWLEAGAGYERVTWREGGVLYRPDLALGFGVELDTKHARARHLGWYLGFRSVLARAPEASGPSTCGGPCTMATPPSRNDVSLFFIAGLHWGRS